MTELIRAHCGPDRAAKTVYQLSLSGQIKMSAFDQERATSFRHVADPRIQRAIVLIESRKGRDVTPDQAAELAGLSPRQFARQFQTHIGISPKRFILDTRLRYARFLVENSTLSMTEIAFETGFSDAAHFATTFRKKYNRTPSHVR